MKTLKKQIDFYRKTSRGSSHKESVLIRHTWHDFSEKKMSAIVKMHISYQYKQYIITGDNNIGYRQVHLLRFVVYLYS